MQVGAAVWLDNNITGASSPHKVAHQKLRPYADKVMGMYTSCANTQFTIRCKHARHCLPNLRKLVKIDKKTCHFVQ
jgi:hypothetical protein